MRAGLSWRRGIRVTVVTLVACAALGTSQAAIAKQQAAESAEAARAAAQDAAAEALVAAATAAAQTNAGEDGSQDFSVSAMSSVRRNSRRANNPLLVSDRELATLAAKLETPDDYRLPTPEFRAFDRELRAGLKKATLVALTTDMAPRYGLAPEVLRGLARDWLIARVSNYDLSDDGDLAAYRSAFEKDAARVAATAGYAPFALEIVAQALDVAGNCNGTGFSTILTAAPDKVLASWALARGSVCGELIRGAMVSPERRTSALVMLLNGNYLEGAAAITPEAWLLSDGALARVEAADQPALRRQLIRNLLANLLDSSMVREALARFDALDAETRAAVLLPQTPEFIAHIDGAGFTLAKSKQTLRTPLAAAMVLAGRRSDAAALLEGDAKQAAKLALVDCVFAGTTGPADRTSKWDACGRDQLGMDATDAIAVRYVRETIDQTGSDLYPLIEVAAGLSERSNTSGVMVKLRCKLLTEAQYADLCRNDRKSVANGLVSAADSKDSGSDDNKANAAALVAAGFPGWAELSAGFEKQRIAALAEFTDPAIDAKDTNWAGREAIEPDPSPFPERPLPPELRSAPGKESEAPAWPRGWTHLPQGFAPVRTGTSGALAVAVSQSGRYDPSGEVGAGGYWVHVSRDGGKTWGAPLYTGLADSFPYVVPTRSRLPLLEGETIRLEVAVSLLDTRSITYPPVGLRTRRKARDLFLEVPLSALQADSDNDGLTDIAAHHLLLDQPSALAPFVVGSDRENCPARPDPIRQLRSMLLMRMAGGRQDQALLEGIDKPADAPLSFDWAKMPTAKTWPLFIKGNPADFACMALPVPAFVYGPAGETALQRKTPDFRLLDAPPIIMNRAGTRGFMRWSLGWTGGTTMAVLKPDGWHTVELESWIT